MKDKNGLSLKVSFMLEDILVSDLIMVQIQLQARIVTLCYVSSSPV